MENGEQGGTVKSRSKGHRRGGQVSRQSVSSRILVGLSTLNVPLKVSQFSNFTESYASAFVSYLVRCLRWRSRRSVSAQVGQRRAGSKVQKVQWLLPNATRTSHAERLRTHPSRKGLLIDLFKPVVASVGYSAGWQQPLHFPASPFFTPYISQNAFLIVGQEVGSNDSSIAHCFVAPAQLR